MIAKNPKENSLDFWSLKAAIQRKVAGPNAPEEFRTSRKLKEVNLKGSALAATDNRQPPPTRNLAISPCP
jgi:hypothetical protein